jgi:hypothetical protein
MPIWRTTYNILKAPWEPDYFNPDWMNYDTIQTPPKTNWDYSRELRVEDVDLWEVITEGGGGVGVYAAWSPYAEFYMVTSDRLLSIETFYGPGAQKKLKKYLDLIGVSYNIREVWVDNEDMWLYE